MSLLFSKFEGNFNKNEIFLWVNLYVRCLNGLLQLFKTLAKTSEGVLYPAKLQVLTVSFVREPCRNHATFDRRLFATVAHGCEILISIIDVTGFVDWVLFFFLFFFCQFILVCSSCSNPDHLG